MKTKLIGWFEYKSKKNDADMICFTVVGAPVREDRGSGFYTKSFYISKDDAIEKGIDLEKLRFGDVEISTNAWNSNILEGIKNI